MGFRVLYFAVFLLGISKHESLRFDEEEDNFYKQIVIAAKMQTSCKPVCEAWKSETTNFTGTYDTNKMDCNKDMILVTETHTEESLEQHKPEWMDFVLGNKEAFKECPWFIEVKDNKTQFKTVLLWNKVDERITVSHVDGQASKTPYKTMTVTAPPTDETACKEFCNAWTNAITSFEGVYTTTGDCTGGDISVKEEHQHEANFAYHENEWKNFVNGADHQASFKACSWFKEVPDANDPSETRKVLIWNRSAVTVTEGS